MSMGLHQFLGLEAEDFAEFSPGLHPNIQKGEQAAIITSPRDQIQNRVTTTSIRAICTVFDAPVIAEKFIRLEKYSADPLRGTLCETEQAANLRIEYPRQDAGNGAMAQRGEMLAGLLLRCGFQINRTEVTQAEGKTVLQIAWNSAPQLLEPSPSSSAQLTDHLQALIVADPARAWRINAAAEKLGLTGRSLQRYLLAEGATFSSVLRAARTDVAKHYLLDRKNTLAEIGFCCGYADQAHFQREFRSVVGLTPRKFRLSKLQK